MKLSHSLFLENYKLHHCAVSETALIGPAWADGPGSDKSNIDKRVCANAPKIDYTA